MLLSVVPVQSIVESQLEYGWAKQVPKTQSFDEQSEFIEQLEPLGKLPALTVPITAKTEIKTQTLVKTTIAVVENFTFSLNVRFFIYLNNLTIMR